VTRDAAFNFVLSVIVIGVVSCVAVLLTTYLEASVIVLEPGDDLYTQQRAISDTLSGNLPLLIPGGLALLSIFVAAFGRSGR